MLSRSKRLGSSTAVARSAFWVLLSLSAMLVTAGGAMGDTRSGAASLAAKIADGRPWKTNLAEYFGEIKMTLFPNGSGRSNSFLTPSPTWRPIADGLCLKPSAMIRERCVILVACPNGYDGIENGKVYIALRR
jgi:hypothetical protein